jgi:hypothetical protein
MPRGTTNVAICRCLSGAARAADKCTQLICFRGALASLLRLSPAMTPDSAPGHASWDAGGGGRYPPLTYPSPGTAPPAAVLVPQGVIPRAARHQGKALCQIIYSIFQLVDCQK